VKFDGSLTLNFDTAVTEITEEMATVLEDTIEQICHLPAGSVTVPTGPVSPVSGRRRLSSSIEITFTVAIPVDSTEVPATVFTTVDDLLQDAYDNGTLETTLTNLAVTAGVGALQTVVVTALFTPDDFLVVVACERSCTPKHYSTRT
jgi:hypothetical protein